VRIESRLAREAALDELLRSGTLAVIPSLLDNSPNTVSECIEYGVPFVATRVGGIPELVAEEDRARVLCEPTANDLAAALTRALRADGGFPPARQAHEPRASVDAWLALVESVRPARQREGRRPTQVTVIASGEASTRRAERLAHETRSVEVEVVRADSRRAGLARAAADWVVFLDDDDAPDDTFLDVLVAAQEASNADLVTVAVRPADEPGGVQLFLGEPGALGLVENHYGVVGLLRSDLAAAEPLPDGGADPDWLLFARVALAGARIVSVPEALSEHAGRPGQIGEVPGEGLAILEAFEERGGTRLQDLAQLAATLAASHARLRQSSTPEVPLDGPVDRALRVLRTQGVARLARRAKARRGRQ
jgi:hypothetical protein